MKKVFFSDILNKYFDSEEACVKAEVAEKARQNQIAEARQNQVESRKQAAKLVEEATSALNEAYAELKKAEIEARDKYESIVAPAKKKVQEAEKKRFEAVETFNKKYGVYTKRYTGKEAYDEFVNRLSQMDDLWNIFNF